MRQLKYHEQKLLKKVNFLEYKNTNTTREQMVTAKFLLKDREEYKKYNRIVGMIRKLSLSLTRLLDSDPVKIYYSKKLVNLLSQIGIIKEKKLLSCSEVSVSDFCRRRVAMVVHKKGLVPSYKDADKFVQQGHFMLGSRPISDTSRLISLPMESFVCWSDNSKLKKKIDEFNDEYDDFKYL